MKKYRGWIIFLVVILLGGIVFDSVAAVKPAMPPLREGDLSLPAQPKRIRPLAKHPSPQPLPNADRCITTGH